jgi:hypothetical protein
LRALTVACADLLFFFFFLLVAEDGCALLHKSAREGRVGGVGGGRVRTLSAPLPPLRQVNSCPRAVIEGGPCLCGDAFRVRPFLESHELTQES